MFTLWVGNSYLIKVYDNLLPDAFADKIYDLHTIGNFSWYYSPSTVLARAVPTDNLGIVYKRVPNNITVGYREEETGLCINSIFTKDTVDTPYFSHSSCDGGKPSSIHFDQLSEIVKHLDFEKVNYQVYRVKSNLQFNVTGCKKTNHLPIHMDKITEGDKTLLYYVNDSDGDTLFFDNDLNITKRVTPKKNRAILFDSNMLHAGANPIKNETRIVINIIFKMEKI